LNIKLKKLGASIYSLTNLNFLMVYTSCWMFEC